MTTPSRIPSLTSATSDRVSAIILAFTAHLRRRGFSEKYIYGHGLIARHFLIWAELTEVELKGVDRIIIDCFLQHDCHCASSCGPVHIQGWRKRRTSYELMTFIRFLEESGHTETLGELAENACLLDAFLTGLRNDGYAIATLNKYRTGCGGLIAWLHLSRIRLCDLTEDVFANFLDKQFIYSVPGLFCGHDSKPGSGYEKELRGFLKHLVAIGQITRPQPASAEQAVPERLERFAVWLERHRGIRPRTIHRHVSFVLKMMPELGDNPRAYDAALIRRVLIAEMRLTTPHQVPFLATAMRMYLRFLVSEDSISAALVAAVPSAPRKQLSSLPRYITSEDVEHAISGCGDNGIGGLRDRAILLLLARLALRAGDIVDLRLKDIDWDRAEVRVCGKSRRQAILPLPQDAGDALHSYIATARQRVDEEKVFLCVNAPWRPLGSSSVVSSVAKRALDRVGVKTFAGRGAHVFRHSQATSLLRSGATLDVIQTLLRHTSPNTTMIYAKTDVNMLQQVAQPWIGGTVR